MTKHLFLIGFLVLLEACDKDPSEIYFEGQLHYFDMPAFMAKQESNLQKKNQWVRKKVTKDGRTHFIECGDIDWKQELDPFMEADINRPAWRGEFKVDTISLERVNVITFKTVNEDIPVKNMVVTIDKATGQCLQVTVDRSTDNFLYSSEQKLFFTVGEGYMVKGDLAVTSLFESEYNVETEFIDH